jgi:hypothetical protein
MPQALKTDLGRRHRRLNVIDETIRKTEAPGQHVEIAAFGAGVRLDGKP